MPNSEEVIRDDDEANLTNQSGDSVLDTDGGKPGDSLTTSEKSDPRAAFKEQFTTDNPSTVSDEDPANANDEETQEVEDSSADNELTEDNDDAVDDSAVEDNQTKDENDDENDDDDVDLGIDFDDIEGLEDDEEVEAEEFNPRQDLDRKVWKSTPPEAQQLITKFRRNYKKRIQQQEKDKPFTDFSRNLLDDASKVGMQTDDLMTFIDIGLKAHQGDPKAVELLGSRMVEHGFQPAGPAVDLSTVETFLKGQITALEMDRSVAVELMAIVDKAVGKRVEGKTAQTQQRQSPEQRQDPGQSFKEIEEAALRTVSDMDQKFLKKFGDKWGAIREKVRREVTLEMASNNVSPAQWPKIWKQKAEIEAKAYLVRVKKRKQGGSKLRSNSDSLERGESVAFKDDSGKELTGRAKFHKEFNTR